MKHIVAVVGLSGVGKSTLVRAIASQLPLLHLQASDLIKSEQARRNATISSSEELRLGPVLANQHLLLKGFARATISSTGLVIFDGHAVIFGHDTATEVPSNVFRSLECARIIMIKADPQVIHARRVGDLQRERPKADADALKRQQLRARAIAAQIAAELAIEFRCIEANPEELIEAVRF